MTSQHDADRLTRALQKVVALRPGEARATVWAFCWFFFLLAGYYVLRPLRDEMGVVAGRDFLQYLFSATFFVMLAAVPVYGLAVARLPRARFIPLVYRFFALCLIGFWIAWSYGLARVETARVFFVWASVFNLFVVSVFWSFLADLFHTDQAKRLYGFIAAGGSAGALLGPTLVVALSHWLTPVNMLIVAALFLEAAVFCAGRLERETARLRAAEGDDAPPDATARAGSDAAQSRGVGGNPFAGFAQIARSPYLAGIALWVALLSLAGTFLYFMQNDLVRAASDDSATRLRIFASIDLAVGVLTLVTQWFATGRLVTRFGAGPAAALLPAVFLVGFAALASSPALALALAAQTMQRAANFAFANPARETLFTSVDREEKYKAKNIIDGVVFRGADALWGWAFAGLRGLGLGLVGAALVALPAMALWALLSLALGRAQERRAAQQDTASGAHTGEALLSSSPDKGDAA